MITEARKNANQKWDKANTVTVSTRMSREQAKELKEKLKAHGLTTHTFLRQLCLMCLYDELDQTLRVIENRMSNDERNAELDAIVQGRG